MRASSLRFVSLELILLVFCATPGRAQDLRSELEPKSFANFRHLEGLGPALVSCQLGDRGQLRCAASQILTDVKCERATEVDATSKAVSARVAFKENTFVCEQRSTEDSQALGIVWKVFLMGRDGTTSQWGVRSASAAEQYKAYDLELQTFKSRKALGRTNALLFKVESGVGQKAEQSLLLTTLSFGVEVFSHVFTSVYFDGETETIYKARGGLGLAIDYENRILDRAIGILSLSAGNRVFGPAETRFQTQLSGAVLYEVFRSLPVGPYYELQWPKVDYFRESYTVGALFRYGPIKKKYTLGLQGGWSSRLFEDQGRSESSRGFDIKLSLSARR